MEFYSDWYSVGLSAAEFIFNESLAEWLLCFLVNDQCDTQLFSMCLFLFLTLSMLRVHRAHLQERQIVSIQPLVAVTLCRWPCCVQVRTELLTWIYEQDHGKSPYL
jgi:hypothetical protein